MKKHLSAGERQRIYVARSMARNKQIVEAELASRGGTCIYPGCSATTIEWHHRDPATKTKAISDFVGGSSVAKLRAELALCDPLCRKHHMLIDGRTEKGKLTWLTHPYVRTSRHPSSRLTEENVRDIRMRAARGDLQRDIAARFGVHQTCISHIVLRKNWAWLSD